MPFRVAKSLTTLGLACQNLPLIQHIAVSSGVKWLFCGGLWDILRVVGSSTYYRKNRLLVGLGGGRLLHSRGLCYGLGQLVMVILPHPPPMPLFSL